MLIDLNNDLSVAIKRFSIEMVVRRLRSRPIYFPHRPLPGVESIHEIAILGVAISDQLAVKHPPFDKHSTTLLHCPAIHDHSLTVLSGPPRSPWPTTVWWCSSYYYPHRTNRRLPSSVANLLESNRLSMTRSVFLPIDFSSTWKNTALQQTTFLFSFTQAY